MIASARVVVPRGTTTVDLFARSYARTPAAVAASVRAELRTSPPWRGEVVGARWFVRVGPSMFSGRYGTVRVGIALRRRNASPSRELTVLVRRGTAGWRTVAVGTPACSAAPRRVLREFFAACSTGRRPPHDLVALR